MNLLLPDSFDLLPDCRADQPKPHGTHRKVDDARNDGGDRDAHARHLTVLKDRICDEVHPVDQNMHDNGDHNTAGSQEYRSVKQAGANGCDSLYDPYDVVSPNTSICDIRSVWIAIWRRTV